MEITPELFSQQRRPRFGTTNPELMRMAFWEWMIRGGGDFADIRREPKFKGFGPCHARNAFKALASREEGPVWTFDRYGATRTTLSDGRVVYIGGEHEDFYDPDFCIYNDLVVLTPSNQIEIYGYPAEIFPPTDFHTATLVQNRLFVIGALGYKDARRPGETLVHTVDLSSYEISTVQTSGDKPGWIYEHQSSFDGGSVITLRGGQVIEEHGGEQVYRRNFDEYSLDVNSRVWRRETDRKWHQFKVRQSDGKLFILDQHPSIDKILPEGTELLGEFTLDPEFTQIEIDGVPMSISVGLSSIEIIVQSELPDKMLLEIVEQIRAATELFVGKPCILKRTTNR
jgi:hypothetical protein